VSYALDLDTEVAVEQKPSPEQLVSVKIVKGVLHSARKLERTRKYTIKNSGERARMVLVEVPVDASWKLVEPKEPDEKTREVYRFAVDAQPGKAAELTVSEEQVTHQQVALTNLDSNLTVVYLNSKVVSDKVKQALREAIERREQIADLGNQLKRLESQTKEIDAEQSRIRQNMERLDRNTELYNRYVKKFGEQEDQIETFRMQMRELEQERARRQQELDKFLAELTLE
jgi:DNA repair exonuclease SbcCD ATPase subunit